jgi:hypothetical protein
LEAARNRRRPPARLRDDATKRHPGSLTSYASREKNGALRPSLECPLCNNGHREIDARHFKLLVTIFETYKDQAAYESHLQTPHFKKYKAETQGMVKSLKLIETEPIMLVRK